MSSNVHSQNYLLLTGASLVPVLVFGENEVWHAQHVKQGKLHGIQEAVKR